MKNNNRKAIIVFTRYPVLGKVKTRLASETSREFAFSFYKTCAEHTFNELNYLNYRECDIFIFGSEEKDLHQIKAWTDNSFIYCSQEGDNLGEKMFNAFKKIFDKNYKKVIIVGTDAPDITSDLIQNGFNVLNENDCVIGPANDGGYYLLGFNGRVLNLFSSINWSTNSVLDQTIKKIKKLGIKYFLLDELIDVDTRDDLIQWHSNFGGMGDHPVYLFTQKQKP